MKSIMVMFFSILAASSSWADDCSQPPVASLDCAAQILIDDGLAKRAEAKGWNVYQWPQLLQRKVPVYSKEVGRNQKRTPRRDSFFFWVDHEPGGLFNHGTTFIYVERKSGKIVSHPSQGYPIINGVEYFAQPIESVVKKYIPRGFVRYPWKGTLDTQDPPSILKPIQPQDFLPRDFKFEKPNSPDGMIVKDKDIDWSQFKFDPKEESERWYKRNVRGYNEMPQSSQQAKKESTQCDCPKKTGPKKVLVISGLSKNGERDDMDELVRYYKNLGVGVTYLRSKPGEFQLSGVQVKETHLKNIESAIQQLAKKTVGCCDEVDIFLSGHGSSSGSIEMNVKGKEEVYNRFGDPYNPPRIVDIGHNEGGDLRTAEIRDMLNRIKSCQVKVFIDSCYSGAHLDKGINKIENHLMDDGCLCRAVYTTSTARQVTYDYDIAGMLGELKTTRGDLGKAFLRHQSKLRKEFGDEPAISRRNPLVQATDCISCEDADGDGLLNGIELKGSYSDPNKKDTDGDGLDDLYEKTVTKTNPKSKDTDGDKLSDAEELELGTNPNNADTDGDGLNDKHETFLGTKPNDPDSDEDGLSDGQEVLEYKTNPNNKDTDSDEIPDGIEVENGTDPRDPKSF